MTRRRRRDAHACARSRLDDVDRLRRMFNRLSPDSVYRRFFSPIHEPPRAALLWLADRRPRPPGRPGGPRRRRDRGRGPLRRPGRAPTTAEIAVTVEDAWQHQGVGKRLTARLAAAAPSTTASSRSTAIVLPDNRPALGLLRKLSPDASVRFDDGELRGVDAAARTRADARSQRGSCAARRPAPTADGRLSR